MQIPTLKTDHSDSAYNMHPSNFKKPDLEHTIEFDTEEKPHQSISDLRDLLEKPADEDPTT